MQQPNEYQLYDEKMKQLQEILVNRQKLLTQKNENEMVKKELEILEEDDVVYKLEDGDLQEEDPLEAEICVDQRLEYLEGEIKKCDEREALLRKELADIQKKLQEIQKMALNQK